MEWRCGWIGIKSAGSDLSMSRGSLKLIGSFERVPGLRMDMRVLMAVVICGIRCSMVLSERAARTSKSDLSEVIRNGDEIRP
jgi:hypothetical protein